ncbi:MAG: tripartite tricarboxylate transporter substrate binding protein [Syntrophomonadaceae bacterium]|jgi:tripartite-type tricarboxylate transporter receptor subunit TctC
MNIKGFLKKKVIFFIVLIMVLSIAAIGCDSSGGSEKNDTANYPVTNINGIIPWGAGGATDICARTLVPFAEEVLGKTIIMTNKTGGGGTVGTQYVYDQKPDGYTILFAAENPSSYQVLGLSSLSYADFEPIIVAGKGNTAIIVHKNSKYNTFQELIDDAKANPGKIVMGISGVGTQTYVANAIITKVDGVEFTTVAFEGEGPIATALLGEQVDVTGVSLSVAMQYIKSGDVKCLGIMSNEKIDLLPDIPAIGEERPEYRDLIEASGFFQGAYMHKDTPPEIQQILRDAFQTAFKAPKFQEYLKENGITPLGYTGDEAKEYTEMWRSKLSWLIYESGAAKESPEKFNIPKP